VEKEKILRLLILEDSLNDAELLASSLRNAGYAVRPSSAEDEDTLREVLSGPPLDLVLCSNSAEEPSLQQTLTEIKRAAKDLPVIAVADTVDSDATADALRLGACDLVGKDNAEHLCLVVERELSHLETRRKLREAEKTLREAEKRCHTLLDNSRDAITYVHEGMHIYANPVYLEMFGFDVLEDVEGLPIMDMVAPQDHSKFKEFLRGLGNGKEERGEMEVVGLRADASTFNAAMEFSPASIDGERCTQIVIRDQSIDKELEKKIKYLSKQDLLTGLYNRQYFMEELEQAISKTAGGEPGSAVLYMEPDNFRNIKETVGIAGGDLVLSDIANLLREAIDETAVPARFGDSSFTVLVPDSDAEQATAIAEKVRLAVENHIADVTGTSVTATCSIGISLVGEATRNAQESLSQADLACEMASKKGGNAVHLHNPVADREAGAERDQQWTELLRDALDNDRFLLVYQPIVSLHGETQERYEVLMRMTDPDGKEIMPGQFIQVAEQNGLMGEVDRWVVAHAIHAVAERRRAGHETTLFVKLSAQSLQDEELLPWLSQELQTQRLQGDSLVFEVAEATAVTHLKQVKTLSKGLQELHCGFSLEHFGNGMNSFQLLKHLSVDYLKIDGSFMHNLATDQENQTLIKSITEMAHSMGKTTIAEFVEDANSLAVLWQCGVNFIQGHFLAEPTSTLDYDFEGEQG